MPSTDSDRVPFWQFVPLAEYARPSEPAREKVRRGLWGLWNRLIRQDETRGRKETAHEYPRETSLQLSVAAPNWQEAVPALDQALQDWLARGRENTPLKLILAAPASGVRQIVSLWARSKNLRVLEPPEARQLLAGKNDGLRELDIEEVTPWLIPGLEDWYLRHGNGLELVRQLLDRLAARRGLTLVCCDTWAWAYLAKTVQADVILPPPLVLAPFDRERLGYWFRALTRLNGDCPAEFRQAGGSKYVLPPVTTKGVPEMSDFLGRLAAYSRGIPGVGRALWQHGLKSAGIFCPEREITPGSTTVRLRPWQELDFPKVPSRHPGNQAFVLHTLLLHRGAATRLLPDLLPTLTSQLRRDLHELEVAGLVVQEQEVWRVTPLGYPAVRTFLEVEGYLVDVL